MAISWRHVRGSERPARDTYATLERELIANAADNVKAATQDTGMPGWWRLNNIRDRARLLVQQLAGRAVTAARQAVTVAARTGKQQAERDLRARHLDIVPTTVDQQVAAAAAREITASIQATVPHAIRSGDELYRQALLAITSQPATSEEHRLRIAQRVMDDLAAQGITGFVDKAGRNWNIGSYVEMATRAAALNAAVDSHVGTLAANGQNLVVVSSATDCCPRCAVYDGHVLSIDRTGTNTPRGAGHPRRRARGRLVPPALPLCSRAVAARRSTARRTSGGFEAVRRPAETARAGT